MKCEEACNRAIKSRYIFWDHLARRVDDFCKEFCSRYNVYWNGRVYEQEDKWLFTAIPLIIHEHTDDWLKLRKTRISSLKIHVHKIIAGKEFDVLIDMTVEYRTRTDNKLVTVRNYTIGLELKDHDVYGAIIQASERRQYTTWFYAVIGLEPNTVIHTLLANPSILKKAVEYSIGVIAHYGSIPVMILRSTKQRKYMHPTITEYLAQYKEKLRSTPQLG